MINESKVMQLSQFPVAPEYEQSSQSPSKKDRSQTGQAAKKRRFQQPLYVFFLVIIAELFTAYAILLLVFVQNETITYAIYIGATIVRCGIWFFSSWQLIGFCLPMARLYFLLDNILLFQLASDAAYVGLNYQKTQQLSIEAMAFYPFLLFFMAGNYRVMLVYCDWMPWQVLLYKLVKFNAALFYLVYGIYISITQQIDNVQLFLLFIFSTFGYYTEIIATFNALDQSDNLVVHLRLKDDECSNLYIPQEQTKSQKVQEG